MMGIQIRLQQLFLMKIRKCSEILSSVHVIPLGITVSWTCANVIQVKHLISADPNRRVVAILFCKIQTAHIFQDPKSKIQEPKIRNPKSMIQEPKISNPKLKIQPGAIDLPHKERILPQSQIPNPKSKTQDPTSKIQNPRSKTQNPTSKTQNPKSEIQNPRPKIQNPRSKTQNPKSKWALWILDFGSGMAGRGLCRKYGHPGHLYLASLVGAQDCNRKVPGSVRPARFPAPSRGNWGPLSRKNGGLVWRAKMVVVGAQLFECGRWKANKACPRQSVFCYHSRRKQNWTVDDSGFWGSLYRRLLKMKYVNKLWNRKLQFSLLLPSRLWWFQLTGASLLKYTMECGKHLWWNETKTGKNWHNHQADAPFAGT